MAFNRGIKAKNISIPTQNKGLSPNANNLLMKKNTAQIYEQRAMDIKKALKSGLSLGGETSGTRTQDPNIKSVVLYQLS